MSGHGARTVYHMVGEDDIVDTLCLPAAGCPVSGAATATLAAATAQPKPQPYKFGRLFDRNPCAEGTWPALAALGRAMNAKLPEVPAGKPDPNDSNIPAGYTYLGQFIAHELTFAKTEGLQAMAELPALERTPTLDLDSLYGGDKLSDEQRAEMYNGDELRVGQVTIPIPGGFTPTDVNSDLPRESDAPYKAVIGDERNDENLPLAQTHLAFIKFHNRVVQYLVARQVPKAILFKEAQRTVIKHFQKIVLDDFLPRIIDPTVLKAVLENTVETEADDGTVKVSRLIDERMAKEKELFMPVEFSAAAFRLGHTMVRRTYEYNEFHRTVPYLRKPAELTDFFKFTQFSGDLNKQKSLISDWVIDWRRFYDFSNMPAQNPKGLDYNRAKKINTGFHLHLDEIDRYPHNVKIDAHKAITVRNLVRGCCLSLPTGQSVAKKLRAPCMNAAMVTDGETPEVRAALTDSQFKFDENTPLWFYILKEAKLLGEDGNRLGPVGSRIVAETFYAIIKHSAHSILGEPLKPPEMLQGRTPGRFDMVDMLTFMGGAVSPTLDG